MLRDIDKRNIQIVVSEDDLKEVFRTVLSDLLSEREEKKKDGRIARSAACKRLGKTPSSLYRWEQAGKLHPIKIGRDTYYWEREIVDIEEGRV